MSLDLAYIAKYFRHLHSHNTIRVFGFDQIFAYAAATLSVPAVAKLVSAACYDSQNPSLDAISAIVQAIHARICISLGINNHSNTSTDIFNDVIIAIAKMNHLKRSLIQSLVPASITALCALAYYTLVIPLPTLYELSLGILCPSILVYMGSLVFCTSFLVRPVTATLHPASGTQRITVHPDSPYYEIFRLFANGIRNQNDTSFTFTAQDIANRVSLKYRIPHLHSMSEPLMGIPDPDVFAHEAKEHPEFTTPMGV